MRRCAASTMDLACCTPRSRERRTKGARSAARSAQVAAEPGGSPATSPARATELGAEGLTVARHQGASRRARQVPDRFERTPSQDDSDFFEGGEFFPIVA